MEVPFGFEEERCLESFTVSLTIFTNGKLEISLENMDCFQPVMIETVHSFEELKELLGDDGWEAFSQEMIFFPDADVSFWKVMYEHRDILGMEDEMIKAEMEKKLVHHRMYPEYELDEHEKCALEILEMFGR